MNITENEFNYTSMLTPRDRTCYIVLHHRAGEGDIGSIHTQHLKQGYIGIGYHFYIRKDGSIYRGRPINMVGAHCLNYNHVSVSICFEGNFENEKINDDQLRAGKELVKFLKEMYPNASVVGHKELNNTACPGKNFPIDEIKKGVLHVTIDEAIKIVQTKAGLEDDTIKFLLCYKYGEDLLVKLAKTMI